MKNHNGFTSMSVIMVLLLILLVIVSVPQFRALSLSQKEAAVARIASSLSAENLVNFTSRMKDSSKGVAIANCSDMAKVLKEGLSSDYQIASAAVAVGTTVDCVLVGPEHVTASFAASGIN